MVSLLSQVRIMYMYVRMVCICTHVCTSSRRENPHNLEHRHLLPLLTHKLTFNKMRPPRDKMVYNLQPVDIQKISTPTHNQEVAAVVVVLTQASVPLY